MELDRDFHNNLFPLAERGALNISLVVDLFGMWTNGASPEEVEERKRVWVKDGFVKNRGDATEIHTVAVVMSNFYLINAVYEISMGLAERLYNTELRGLKGRDLQMPFRCLYLRIPSILPVVPDDPECGKVNGVYLLQDKGEKPGSRTFVLLFSTPRYPTDLYTFEIEDDENLDDVLPRTNQDYERLIRYRSDRARDWNTDWIMKAVKWAFNVCLYATGSDKIEVVEENKERAALQRRLKKAKGTKKEKLKARLSKETSRVTFLLGRGVPRLQPENRGSGKPLEVRTLVQGHWRGYWHGRGIKKISKEEREKLREKHFKLQWVEPFWRGPKEGIVSNPVRVVDQQG